MQLEIWRKVDILVIEERMKSDYLPICVYIQAENLWQSLLKKEEDFRDRNLKKKYEQRKKLKILGKF